MYLVVQPIFHIYGPSLCLGTVVVRVYTVVVMRRFDPNVVVKAIDRYGATHFPMVVMRFDPDEVGSSFYYDPWNIKYLIKFKQI